ncbi:LRR receptor-like serine/threonine-protein kinase RGI2 [Polyrhizophydium stewartii]|uniref:LRR receptor-like serine/threonine-protein kinase RGI2 n=1 Tax=Polyrhizophydium stewartii TaxID=2732419 RepID=A0ABR4MX08_9FUNG
MMRHGLTERSAGSCRTRLSGLTLGIPMVDVLFGDRPDFAVVVLPLLMYHPTQILLDSMLTGALRAWVLADRRSSTKTK